MIQVTDSLFPEFIVDLGRTINLFQIHDNIKLGLISYSLLGFIEHHGTYINSGHYICYTKYYFLLVIFSFIYHLFLNC